MIKIGSKPDFSFAATIANGGELSLEAHNSHADYRLNLKRKPAPGKAVSQPFPLDMTREELLRLRDGIEAMLLSACQYQQAPRLQAPQQVDDSRTGL